MTPQIVILSTHRKRECVSTQILRFESFGHAQKFAKDVERLTASADYDGPILHACIVPAEGLLP